MLRTVTNNQLVTTYDVTFHDCDVLLGFDVGGRRRFGETYYLQLHGLQGHTVWIFSLEDEDRMFLRNSDLYWRVYMAQNPEERPVKTSKLA